MLLTEREKPTELVMAAIEYKVDRDGKALVSVARIAQITGLTGAEVVQEIDRLKYDGRLVVRSEIGGTKLVSLVR